MGLKLSQRELEERLRGNPEMTIDRRYSGVDSSLILPGGTLAADRIAQVNANRISGENFQKRLDDYHYWNYETTGRAWVRRTAPEAHFGMGGSVFARKGPVDYVASIKNLVSVHFDAKVCSADIYHISIDEMHQLTYLRKQLQFGQIAGYVIWWTKYNVACWHPISLVDDAKVPFATGIQLNDLDWLTVVQNSPRKS